MLELNLFEYQLNAINIYKLIITEGKGTEAVNNAVPASHIAGTGKNSPTRAGTVLHSFPGQQNTQAHIPVHRKRQSL